MREIVIISVGEISMKTSYDIESKTNSLCKQYHVRCILENKRPVWGYKISAILDGDKEDIEFIKKNLKVDFNVKTL